MKKKKKKRLLFINIILSFLVMADHSFADGYPPMRIYSAIQKDAYVVVTIGLGGEALSWKWRLTWTRGAEERKIFDNREFQKDEAAGIDEYCSDSLPDCEDVAGEDCVDCDGDDYAECPVPCGNIYRFKEIHECAPVGAIVYTLLSPEDSDGDEYYKQDQLGIIVEDSGVHCDSDAGVDSGTDADADTDSDADLDTDDDSDDASQDEGAGCGVVHGAASSSELILAFLMITAGLAAFRFRHS